jgi:hypothetical protein
MKKRFSNTPLWVLPAFASLTIVLQGIPPIFEANEIVSQKTAQLVDLICDVLNVITAAATFFFSKSETLKKD